jgi:hypothetical protein
VTAKAGYEVGFAPLAAGTWNDASTPLRLSYDDTDAGAGTFYVREAATGRISRPVAAGWKVDTVSPGGAITMRGNVWKTLANTITFGYFFKNTVDATVSGTDATSGIDSAATQWYAHAGTSVLTNDAATWNGLAWQSGSAISVAPGFNGAVYARVYDKAGNWAVVSSEGLVIYADATSAAGALAYVKATKTDMSFDVTLSGNVIDTVALYEGSVLKATLASGSDYTVGDAAPGTPQPFTLKGTWLDTLAAGDYTVVITFKPLGQTYVAATGSEAPAQVTKALTVSKMSIGDDQQSAAVTDVTATGITYGQRLSASTVSATVKSPSDASTVASGNIIWKDGGILPGDDAVSAADGLTPGGYTYTAVWMPSDAADSYGTGRKASDYFAPMEFPVTVAVAQAVPYMDAGARPAGTPILLDAYEKLSASALSGQVYYAFAGNADGRIAAGGTWYWDENADGRELGYQGETEDPANSTVNQTAGVKDVGAVFVPADPRVARYVADGASGTAGHGAKASLTVLSLVTKITVPGTYTVTGTRGLKLASIPASGTLDTLLHLQGFYATAFDGDEDTNDADIPGTFTWKDPQTVLSAADPVQKAVVVFTPTDYVTEAELAGGSFTFDPDNPRYVVAEVEVNVTLAKPVLTGQVTWAAGGSGVYGGTLTVNTSGLGMSPDISATIGMGDFAFEWRRYSGSGDAVGEVIAGATGVSYTLTAADVGKQITATVTAANLDGARTTGRTDTVEPAPQDAPTAPVLAGKTASTITVVAEAGLEYSIDYGAKGASAHWQAEPVFTRAWVQSDAAADALLPDTAYTIYARRPAQGTSPVFVAASPASAGLTVTTNRTVAYTVAQKGGTDSVATSTGLTLTFSAAVSDLTEANILVAGDGVTLVSGSLRAVAGSGYKVWEFDIAGTFANGAAAQVTVFGLSEADVLTLPTSADATATLWRDVTAPAVSAGTVTRTGDTAATIGFTVDEAGDAYAYVLAAGADAPTGASVVAEGVSLGAVAVGAVSGQAVALTAGARDIYVCVRDAAGNVSAPLLIAAGKTAASLTLAPAGHTGLVYSGAAQALAEAGAASGGTLLYAVVSGPSGAAPTDEAYAAALPTAVAAGTYTVWYLVAGDASHAGVSNASWKFDVTIAKADAVAAPPPADAGAVYTGAALALVTDGAASGGSLEYALDAAGRQDIAPASGTVPSGASFGADVPQGTGAGYYLVWYRVVGDANHNDAAPASVVAQIRKAEQAALTLSGTLPLSAGETREVTVGGGSGTGVYGLASTDPSVATVAAVDTAAGRFNVTVIAAMSEYKLVYTRLGDTNYEAKSQTSDGVDAGKDAATASPAPAAENGLVYDGTPQALVTAGTPVGGSLVYWLDDGVTDPADAVWSDAVPEGTDAKTYKVWYMVSGDPDHNDSVPTAVTVTIAKAASTVTAPTAAGGLVYTGTAQALISAGAASGGTLEYRLGTGGAWGTSVPEATGAGSYTVYYRVTGDANHEDDAGGSVAVAIAQAEPQVATVGTVATVKYDDPLSSVSPPATGYTFEGVGSETVTGVLSWDGGGAAVATGDLAADGTFAADVVFTPTGASAANYVSITFAVTVPVVASDAARALLDSEVVDDASPEALIFAEDEATGQHAGMSEEDYPAGALAAFANAYALAQAVAAKADSASGATQHEVTAAQAALAAAEAALVPDHPVEEVKLGGAIWNLAAGSPVWVAGAAGASGTTGTTGTVGGFSLRVKGHLPHVATVTITGETAGATHPGGAELWSAASAGAGAFDAGYETRTYALHDAALGKTAGTLTHGSAVVSLADAYLAALAPGKYRLTVVFSDAFVEAAGAGSALEEASRQSVEFEVKAAQDSGSGSGGTGGTGNDPGSGAGAGAAGTGAGSGSGAGTGSGSGSAGSAAGASRTGDAFDPVLWSLLLAAAALAAATLVLVAMRRRTT